jgi:histidyl-tRNA synthetase
MQKPSVPKGTRDFLPDVAARRKYIVGCIESSFVTYGFKPIETPAMENLSTLTGKYGEEGDKLLFKVLNNGDFLAKAPEDKRSESNHLLPFIAEKGLRYDLTVPFARFVVQNRNEITFPFRRYQIQPVWRADRPQKGRYREFWQCDADIIGTDSLFSEYELICIYADVFKKLKIKDYILKINNRKILEGVAEIADCSDRFKELTIIIDKFDKVGAEGVTNELTNAGFSQSSVEKIMKCISTFSFDTKGLNEIASILKESEVGMKGLIELKEILNLLVSDNPNINIEIDLKLARGLDYYTGCIFEVVPTSMKLGSISGGGRYDNLTEIFGLKDVSGVGISFGLDRIYDLMMELNLFPEMTSASSTILFCPMDSDSVSDILKLLSEMRKNGVSSEMYPKPGKLKRQLDYANKNGVRFTAILGSQEREQSSVMLKDMVTGEQNLVKYTDLLNSINEFI